MLYKCIYRKMHLYFKSVIVDVPEMGLNIHD